MPAAAGLFGPEVVLNGNLITPVVLALTSVTVKNTDNSAATLYTDATAVTTTSNVITTDAAGRLSFYAVPGFYKIAYTDTVGAQSLTIEVPVDTGTAAATYAAAADSMQLARMNNLSATDQVRTSRLLAKQYEDDTAKIHHRWPDLTGWTPTTVLQVASGNVYTRLVAAALTAPYGAATAFVVPTATAFRMTAAITLPSIIPGGGFVGIGLSTVAPPLTGFAVSTTLWGIAGDVAKKMSPGGATANLSQTGGGGAGTSLAAGTYIVTIIADTARVSVTLTNAAHTIEYVDNFPWTSFPAGFASAAVIMLDDRELSGASVRPLGATRTLNTISPRTPTTGLTQTVEGVGDFAHTAFQVDSSVFRVVVPKSYDSRVPAPLCIFYHGSQANGANATWTDTGIRSVVQALLDAGYIVASSDAAGSDTWGNQASVDDYAELYRFCKDNFAIGAVVHLAQSMGGLASLLTLAERKVPAAAWAGIYPVTNLANLYADPTRTAAINTAFGITGVTPNTYAEKTLNHDPNLLAGTVFRGLPFRFYASAADTVVTKANNSDLFAAKVAAYGPEETVVVHTGNHGDATAFQPSDVLAFFERYVKAAAA